MNETKKIRRDIILLVQRRWTVYSGDICKTKVPLFPAMIVQEERNCSPVLLRIPLNEYHSFLYNVVAITGIKRRERKR